MQRTIVFSLLALAALAFTLPAQPSRAPIVKELLPHDAQVGMGSVVAGSGIRPSLTKQAGTAAASSPQLFPFQALFLSNPSLYAPVALPDGQIFMFYASDNFLYYAVSADTGATWDPVTSFAFQSPSFVSSLSAFRTSTGRLLIVWNTSLGAYRISSDNSGLNWSTSDTVAPAGNSGYTISEPDSGTLWLTYQRTSVTTRSDIFFRKSTNNGTTWGAEQTLLASEFNEFSGTVVSGGGSTLAAFYVDNSINDRNNLYRRTSTDGGSTWSAPAPALADTLIKTITTVVQDTDESLHMILGAYSQHFPSPFFVGGFYPNIDLYSMTSTDGGATWSAPARLTKYAGRDAVPRAARVGSQTFVSFGSSRGTGDIIATQIWTLLAETATDDDTPPNPFYFATGGSDVAGMLQIVAQVSDDDAVTGTTINWSADGGTPVVTTMFDDGGHGDYQAGDLIYGALIGPVQIDDQILFSFTVTDNSANFATSLTFFVVVPGLHNVGNIVLAIGGNSRLGTSGTGNSFTWPRDGGQDYLYVGGFWAGAVISSQPRVSYYHYGTVNWQRTPSTPFNLGPGISDQDGQVTYDDAFSPTPVGLRVLQRSYQWANTTRDDFVIFKYAITNTGTNGALDSVFATLWLDPDVPPSFSSNLAGYDPTRNLMYMWSSTSPGGYFGIALLEPATQPRTAHFYGPIADNTDALRFQLMTAGITSPPTSATDYRTVLTAPPFPLLISETRTVAYGLVIGNGLAELQQHTDTMRAIYAAELLTGVEEQLSGVVPREFLLDQNYPNPFNSSTVFRYAIARRTPVVMKVYDLLGRERAVLVNKAQEAGSYHVVWNAETFESGMYLVRLHAGGFTQTRKVVLVK